MSLNGPVYGEYFQKNFNVVCVKFGYVFEDVSGGKGRMRDGNLIERVSVSSTMKQMLEITLQVVPNCFLNSSL